MPEVLHADEGEVEPVRARVGGGEAFRVWAEPVPEVDEVLLAQLCGDGRVALDLRRRNGKHS